MLFQDPLSVVNLDVRSLLNAIIVYNAPTQTAHPFAGRACTHVT